MTGYVLAYTYTHVSYGFLKRIRPHWQLRTEILSGLAGLVVLVLWGFLFQSGDYATEPFVLPWRPVINPV